MAFGNLIFLLLLLACPLMMVWMMRGHGHGGHGAGGHHGGGCGHGKSDEPSVGELRRQRAELDARIESLEEDERQEPAPAAPGAPFAQR